ncbi:MAG: Ig-like domain-containing protein [Planctomycetes bacterium]|nr:Ig-like domain-containing protein [Planctomycetota bacterium]
MRTFVPTLLAGGFATSLLLTGCSGGGSSSGSGAGGGTMFIQTCSLGCSSGTAGSQVSCSIVSTSVNNELSIYFSEPVNPNSITSTTLQLIDVNSGQVPVGTRFVDPNNPRRVVFRPLITFDATGSPTFGFEANKTYRITIPGQAQGDSAPFITSLAGKANRSRMQCDIQTNQGVIDLVPGAPVATVEVDLAVTGTVDPNDRIEDQPADGATDVWRSSTIRIIFNDVMNPVTLLNQITHQATFITTKIDPDGNLGTTADQVPFPGSYDLQLDLDNLRTILTFTAPTGLPSGGIASNRKVLLNLPSNLQDLAGNNLSNPSLVTFTPETVSQGLVTLPDDDGENFDTTDNCDLRNSSADWGSGRLVRGFGGGSGRLGKLLVRTGETCTLDTDSQQFPLEAADAGINQPRDLLDNELAGTDYDPADPDSWPTLTITDGAFEFSSITIESGATLRFVGSNPARLFSRGNAIILGTIDVRGSTPADFDSFTTAGQSGAIGGPGGGAGGAGGDRVNNATSTGTNGLLTLTQPTATPALPAGTCQGISNPTADINGRPSEGIDQSIGGLGAASGGLHYPAAFPTTRDTLGVDAGDLAFTNIDEDQVLVCFALMVANPGGGGGYGTAGGNGQASAFFPTAENGSSNLPPAVAGDADGDGGPGGTAIGLEPADPESDHNLRRLAVEVGALRGGSGGGGGGTHLFNTHHNANSVCVGATTSKIDRYYDCSGSGGGGGGGAVQIVSGKTLQLSGTVDARGGNGGSAVALPIAPFVPTNPINNNLEGRRNRAAPGGGGSGGAVRVQGQVVAIDGNLQPGTSRVDVTGGAGGVNDYCDTTVNCVGRGGAGGAGLIRIEDLTGLLTRSSEAPKLLPFNSGTDAESRDWLSVGLWTLPRRRPESFTGAVSCWMRPTGNFFDLSFAADDLGNPDEALRYGWNMEVLYDDGGPLGERAINYRGPDADSPFASDLETVLRNNLNYGLPAAQRSYFTVRFQGATLLSSYNGSLCDVNVNNFSGTSSIVGGSLTPWVRNPHDLDSFSPKPNMIRFTITFDTALETPGSVASFIKGIRDLKIRCQPD